MNLQGILYIASRLVEIGLIEFKPGMGLGEIEAEYRERVSSTMQDYMDSDRNIVSFRNSMRRLTNDSYLLAAVAGWVDGGGDGPMPDSLTEYVNQQVEAQFTFIDDVFAKLKELRKSGTADEQAAYIEGRADGYTASIQGIYDYARVMAAADILLTFDGPDGSPTSVCSKTGGTCVKLKGQTHPASWWIERNLVPYRGNVNFDCQCWNCRHSLFDKDGNVWANQQQVSEFDPDQPRDDAGRFSSTGGGGGSGGDEGGSRSGDLSSLPNERRALESNVKLSQPFYSAAGINDLNDAYGRIPGEMKAKIVDNLSEVAGVDSEKVQLIIDSWAETSNDTDAVSLSIQTTAADVFESPLSEWQKSNIEDVGEHDVKYSENTAKVLSASYKETQEMLKDAGFKPNDSVVIYRGVTNIIGDGMVDYIGNAIESWSFSPLVAYDFAGTRGGTILVARVRISDIVSSCVTGLGCLKEGELIVKGMSKGVTVRSYGVEADVEYGEYKFHEDKPKKKRLKVVIDNERDDDWIKAIQPTDEIGMAKNSSTKTK
jgi:hypothetical protein